MNVPCYKSDKIFFACALLLLLFPFECINMVQEMCVGERVHVWGIIIRVCCDARLVFAAVSVRKEHKEPVVGVKAQPLVL